MPISNSILGINARNFLYIKKYNKPSAKKLADDKLATKKRLLKHGIPTARLLYSFSDRKSIKDFSWDLPSTGFVIKPARGYGGEGIIVFRSWHEDVGETVSDQLLSQKEIESHMLDILEGAYSLQYLPDQVMIEEKIATHPFFRKLAHVGLPDIRVIVFNKVPVMAMMRLPTEESKGKANLHLGALGIGIGIKTGITTNAIQRDKPLLFIPGTKIKAHGIKIPYWNEILTIASRTQEVSKLGYAGIDIVIDEQKGPLVLEVNARPGLSIQNANLESLRPRLERLHGLSIQNIDRGLEVARSLFAEDFAEKVRDETTILSVVEPISVYANGQKKDLFAKIDSGAFRTSIDKSLVDELHMASLNQKVLVTAASGQQHRPVVQLEFVLKGKRIKTTATYTDRSRLKYPIIIGRRDLKGFLIDPDSAPEPEDITFEDEE